MHFTNAIVLAGAAVAAAKQTLRVDVGKNGLTYTPASVQAQVGDDVQFHYFPEAHSVVQSSFANPCVPLASGGFFSGFVPTAPEQAGLSTFTITVNDTKPIWFYCGHVGHCQTGMVGSVNAPETGNTLDAFTTLAKATKSTINPPSRPNGGTLKIATNSTSTTSTTTPAGTTGPSSGSTVTATGGAGKLGGSVLAVVAAIALL